MSFSLSLQINDLHYRSLIWAPRPGCVDDFLRSHQLSIIVKTYRTHSMAAWQPDRTASRVFWIVDNGSSHRGKSSIERLQKAWPQAVLVRLPVHTSWLNQIEIYFSIVQRKVLTPYHFESLAELEDRLMNLQDYYEKLAEPFKWKFTRQDLANLMKKTDQYISTQKIAA